MQINNNFRVFKLLFLFFLILFCNNTELRSQNVKSEYYNAKSLKYDDYIYKENIKTVQVYTKKWELAFPAIPLNGEDAFILAFDDVEGGYKDYMYTLIHCDAAWNPSDLLYNEYLETFQEDHITSYYPSTTAIKPYTHYELDFSTSTVKPTISGNYLLKVYLASKPDDIIITRRLMYFENTAGITASIKRSFKQETGQATQNVDFKIDINSLQANNVTDQIKVKICQNNRSDNAIFGLKPRFIRDGILEYNYDNETAFLSGNEFRHIDLKTLRHYTDRSAKIFYDSVGYHVYILPDIMKGRLSYSSDRDINGRFLIKNEDGFDGRVDGDYVNVHFQMPCNQVFVDGTFYVIGDFNNYSINKSSRLNYNTNTRSYETSVLLKQGYYNYQYVYVKNGQTKGETYISEGNFQETENEYTIMVYFRPPASLTDYLVGYISLNSR